MKIRRVKLFCTADFYFFPSHHKLLTLRPIKTHTNAYFRKTIRFGNADTDSNKE